MELDVSASVVSSVVEMGPVIRSMEAAPTVASLAIEVTFATMVNTDTLNEFELRMVMILNFSLNKI